jgi:hypothetical protein
MRSRRLLMVLGLSIGACALTATAASACILQSAGALSLSGGTVRQGDQVRITMYAIATDESPGASPYVITANDVEIARGQATPDANGGWTGEVTLRLDALGTYSGPVHIVVTLTDSYQPLPVPTPLQYDGTPAPAQPRAPAPVAVKAPAPATRQTPAPAARPVTGPGAGPRTKRPRPRNPSGPAPRAHAKPQATSRAVRAPRASHVQTPVSQVRRTVEPAAAALPAPRPFQPAVRTSRPANRTEIHRTAPLGARTISRRVAADAPVTQPSPRPTAAAAAPNPTAPFVVAGALLLLALLAGGAGLAVVAVRRRSPLAPEPPDRLAEMEAELQELLAEERLRAEAEGAPAAPS